MDAEPLVLISTSDVEFFLLLNHVFYAEGFETLLVGEPDEIQQAIEDRRPDLILQDCKFEKPRSTEAYGRVKQTAQANDIPLIALVGADASHDHIALLKAGIKEVLARPVSPSKLLERIRALIGMDRQIPGETVVAYADVEMDLKKHKVFRDGQDIHLGPIEFRILRHLLENPGQVFTRDDLIGAVWPSNVYVVQRTVDVHMGRLRKALKERSGSDLIRTVRSVGYGLAD